MALQLLATLSFKKAALWGFAPLVGAVSYIATTAGELATPLMDAGVLGVVALAEAIAIRHLFIANQAILKAAAAEAEEREKRYQLEAEAREARLVTALEKSLGVDIPT